MENQFGQLYPSGMSTAKGSQLLAAHPALQEVVEAFLAHEYPERHVPSGRVIGFGRYGYTFGVDGFIIKITSPMSTRDALVYNTPLEPENLTRQFTYLSQLRDYLEATDPSITAPEQFFALASTHGALLLCQQYMEKWQPLSEWSQVIDDRHLGNTEAALREKITIRERIRERIITAMEGSPLIEGLNDLHLFRPLKLHGENLLVPTDVDPCGDAPVCIIDQPGNDRAHGKRIKAQLAAAGVIIPHGVDIS